jgi:hypothetical protein
VVLPTQLDAEQRFRHEIAASKRENRMIEVTHTPARGRLKGVPQPLYRYPDGKYVVSLSKHERDYIRVDTQEEALNYIQRGFGARFGEKYPSFVKVVRP